MAKVGQVLENPVNGDRLIFRKTAHEGDGSEWETELFYRPFAGRLPIAHFHPTIDEQYVAGLPIGVQRLLFGVLAGIGRLLGYKARYPETSLDG